MLKWTTIAESHTHTHTHTHTYIYIYIYRKRDIIKWDKWKRTLDAFIAEKVKNRP